MWRSRYWGRNVMEILDLIITLLIATGVPSIVCGALISRLDKKLEKKEQARAQHEVLLMTGIEASISLGEATARAVQRIPDAKCNGDMHEALDYATGVKHEMREFLKKQTLRWSDRRKHERASKTYRCEVDCNPVAYACFLRTDFCKDVVPSEFIQIYTVIMRFYFGTQAPRKRGEQMMKKLDSKAIRELFAINHQLPTVTSHPEPCQM